ncbi:MAG: carboxypeptidase regulatory-like domain-containing protein [Planctomycetes bacterium]|nr:carboxypeptidase regulatory-like domain-containing protein [Planctomycetota bacterium]
MTPRRLLGLAALVILALAAGSIALLIGRGRPAGGDPAVSPAGRSEAAPKLASPRDISGRSASPPRLEQVPLVRKGVRAASRVSPQASAEKEAPPGAAAGHPDAPGRVLNGLLLEVESGKPLPHLPAAFRLESRGSISVRQATTDGEGRFRLRGLPGGALILHTRAPGYLPDVRRVEATEGMEGPEEPEGPPVAIGLERGLALEGRVADAAGQPLAGAQLRLSRAAGAGLDSRRALSAADGAFVFSGLLEGPWILQAVLAGYRAPAGREIQVPPAGLITLILEADRPIPVRAVDSSLQPISDAVIRFAPKASSPRAVALSGGKSTKTDGSGLASLSGLPAPDDGIDAVAVLEVSHRDHVPLKREVPVAELERGGPAGAYELILSPGGELAGQVLDAAGQAAAGVRMSLKGPARRDLNTVSGGRFRFPHLPPGAYILSADGGPQGHAHLEGLEVGGPEAPAALTVNLKKEPGSIVGRVLGAQRRPAARAPVNLLLGDRRFSAQTDEQGRFSFEGIPEGTYRLRAGTWRTGERALEGVATGTGDRELVLPALGSLQGVLKTAGPARPFQVRLEPAARTGEVTGGEAAGGEETLVYRFSARTLEFRCPNVPEGIYDLWIERDGKTAARLENVAVMAGAEATRVEIEAEGAAGG